ncbi:integrin beta-2 [Aphelenchoides avenae]|nr:integrin beta-2 [Aphelenchus avenae]
MCHCFPRANAEHRVYGAFCECDNFNCPRHNRMICGGNGTCECGFCQCNPGLTGPACECPTSTETCLANNGNVCNRHGECICGKCQCGRDEDGVKYSGPTCEETVSYGADVSEVHIYT